MAHDLPKIQPAGSPDRQSAQPPDPSPPWLLSRRSLLVGGAALVTALFPRRAAGDEPLEKPTGAPLPNPPVPPPWWLSGRSRVIDLQSREAVRDSLIHLGKLDQMLQRALVELTGASTLRRAWRSVLGESKRILLKFNEVSDAVVAANEPFGRLLVDQLVQAGWAPGQITLVGVSRHIEQDLQTRPAAPEWGEPIQVSGLSEPLANFLLESDAAISIGLLKTHQLAGMSGCMKNLSHAVIRHPARHHSNGCSPAVGQVIGSPPIASRLKLCLLNAMRIVYRRGPDATPEDILDYGGLVAGIDPVAVDAVGLSILTRERDRLGLRKPLHAPYLAAAAEAGVGRATEASIEWIRQSL